MPTKIYISGNFLIAEDAVSRDYFFKINTTKVQHLRSPDDEFSFFQEGFTTDENGQSNSLRLGNSKAWEWDTQELIQPSQTGFEYAEIVDRTGTPYASANAFDDFLNQNLGVSSGGAGGGQVDSVTGLNTDNSDPVNPIVQISVDGVTITGTGTSGNPLVSVGGGGGTIPTLRNISGIDTFGAREETLNCTSGTFTVNLPTAVGIQGTTFTLVNSGLGVITLDADGTETINGSLTINIKRNQLSRTVQSDGSNWIII